MERNEFDKFVRDVTITRTCLSDRQKLHAHKLADVLQADGLTDLQTFMTKHAREPVLITYMVDGWGGKVRSRRVRLLAGVQVVRNAQCHHEFGLQRVVAQTLTANGDYKMMMALSKPVALKHGRTCFHFFTMACKYLGTPWSYGHKDLSVVVYLMDGGLLDPLAYYLEARHTFPRPVSLATSDAAGLEMVFKIRCAAHVGSCGINRGLDIVRQNADTNKTVHVVLSSVRQGSWGILSHVDLFIVRNVRYVDEFSGSIDDIASYWRLMGVEANMIDVVVDIDPIWDGVSLCVNSNVLRQPDGCAQLKVCLDYILRFFNFVDTRWGGVGEPSRCFMRSKSVGLSKLWEMCSEDSTDMSHLHGYAQATPPVLKFLAVAAVGSYPGESFLSEMLYDNRVLRRADEFRDAINSEIEYIFSLKSYAWKRLADLTDGGCTPWELRDCCIRVALISSAYIHVECLNATRELPMSLTQGDIKANLLRLMRADYLVEERNALCLKNALVSGEVSVERAMRALELAKGAPFATEMVEQSHAYGACLLKSHEQYGEQMVCDRGLLCQAGALFKADPNNRTELMLAQELERVDDALGGARRQPAAAYYYSEYMQTAEGKSFVSSGCGARQCLVEALAKFKTLSPQQRSKYGAKSERRHHQRFPTLLDERETLQQQLDLYKRRRLESLRSEGLRNNMNSCRFDDQKIDAIFEKFKSALRSSPCNAKPRNDVKAPRAPVIEEQHYIRDCAMRLMKPLPQIPWYVWHICANRDLFHGVALTIDPGAVLTAYMFNYALKKPYSCEFIQLARRADSVVPGGDKWVYNFSWIPIKNYSAHALPLDWPIFEGLELFVVHGISLSAGFAHTNCPCISFTEFTAGHPRCKNTRRPTRKRKPPALVLDGNDITALLQAHPWLSEKDFKLGGCNAHGLAKRPRRDHDTKFQKQSEIDKSSRANDSCDDSESSSDGAESVSDDSAFDKEELEALKAEWGSAVYTHFYTRLLCGEWTKINKGVLADGCAATGRSSTVKWCKRFKVKQEVKLMYGKWTSDGAHTLLAEYCRRANHFFAFYLDVASEELDEPFVYSQAMLDSYVEDPAFSNWVDDQSELLRAKAANIRSVIPRNP